MKIILNNTELDYTLGCRLLKLKSPDVCPLEDKTLQSIWNDIVPFTFKEIAEMQNIEHRRLGILYFGLDRLVKEINPVLVDTQTLKKTTTWVNEKGETVTHSFDDTYKLFKVAGSYFSKGLPSHRKAEDAYYLECNDTSTDRKYLLWINPKSVYVTNNPKKSEWDFKFENINAIQCVAWTIQTNVKQGNIKRIIRQGDCILIEPKVMGDYLPNPRHITEKEYKTLLVAES